MGKNKGILDVMNEVSGHLDACAPAPVPRKSIDELQAFILIDPLLCSLNKQYLDAKTVRVQTEKDYGCADGMTDMAMLMEDSAWCAVQTRYMELRADRALMKKAQSLMAEADAEAEREEKARYEREMIRSYEQMQMFERMQKARRARDDDFWLWAVVVLWSRHFLMPVQTAPVFNRIAA